MQPRSQVTLGTKLDVDGGLWRTGGWRIRRNQVRRNLECVHLQARLPTAVREMTRAAEIKPSSLDVIKFSNPKLKSH